MVDTKTAVTSLQLTCHHKLCNSCCIMPTVKSLVCRAVTCTQVEPIARLLPYDRHDESYWMSGGVMLEVMLELATTTNNNNLQLQQPTTTNNINNQLQQTTATTANISNINSQQRQTAAASRTNNKLRQQPQPTTTTNINNKQQTPARTTL